MRRLIFSATLVLLAAGMTGLLAACTTARTAPPPEIVTVADLDARGDDGHFTFYSLRDNAIVPVADSASTAWDLAFRATTILVNGGTSGPGEGGAAVLSDTAFTAVTMAPPAEAFTVDQGTDRNETAIPGGAGNGWYDYDFATGIISPRPAVLAIRTADGRFAKVEIISYYQGAPDDIDPEEGFRYYTFRYLFQPDETREF